MPKASSASAKPKSVVGGIVESPFASGSFGAARVHTIKSRLKGVKLPTRGKIRFVPRKNYRPSEPLPRGPNDGFKDRFGNEWTSGSSRTAGQEIEWDVILSPRGLQQFKSFTKGRNHLNVSMDGKITH